MGVFESERFADHKFPFFVSLVGLRDNRDRARGTGEEDGALEGVTPTASVSERKDECGFCHQGESTIPGGIYRFLDMRSSRLDRFGKSEESYKNSTLKSI